MLPPDPLFFGQGRELFGWYHAACGPLLRACSIVLCRPLGHEHVCSYRAFRRLAEKLSESGFNVLRFDYFGTGNAAGTSCDPNLLRRWMDNVSSATHELSVRAPNDSLALVGLRFGGTLAALTSLDRDDVDALVLWEPCVNGESYMRQVKVLGMTTTEYPEHLAAEIGVEAAGFQFSGSTVDAISELKLTQSAGVTGARTLLMLRDDMPSDPRLATHLRTLGAHVEERTFSGYTEFMTAPFKSELPSHAIHDIAQWFTDAYPAVERTSITPAPSTQAAPTRIEVVEQEQIPALGSVIHETAVHFGKSLFGIFVSPAKPDPSLPTAVLLNTGADHNIGPHRMYVPLARQWAARGFSVLRFDLSGIGDSPSPSAGGEDTVYPSHAMDDIRAAVDYLATQGHERVVLVGICSGAYHAVQAARAGIPVIGTIAVNPPLYLKAGDSLEIDPYWNEVETARLVRAMFTPGKWVRFFTGKVDYKYILSLLGNRIRLLSTNALAALQFLIFGTRKPGDKDDVEALFPNTIHTHLIFSRSDPGFTYIERSVGKRLQVLKESPHFSLEVVNDADHTFMPSKLQERLTTLLTDAFVSHFNSVRTPLGPNRSTKLADAP